MEEIYKNQVKSIGKDVGAFAGADFLIIFGDSAPAELKDYCYGVDVNPINGQIKAGDVLRFDDQEYTITSIGPEMPGSMYVEKKPLPEIHVGTVIQIVRK